MNYINAEQLLTTYINKEVQIEIAKTINKGYQVVKKIQQDNDFMNSLYAKNIITYLSSIVVETFLEKEIKNNKLPFKCKAVTNVAKNHYHLEARTSDNKCLLTINQTKYINEIPKLSIFRKNHSLSNQLSIDDLFKKERKQLEPFYMLITHGHYKNKLNFINVGVPAPYITKWLDRINLLDKPYVLNSLSSPKYKEEIIEENDLMLDVIEQVEKRVSSYEK